jgi:hypothetical protein
MRYKVLGFLSLVLAVTPSFAALKQGDTAPDFKTQASLAGKEFTFSLRDALKKGPVVVYFYAAVICRHIPLRRITTNSPPPAPLSSAFRSIVLRA